MIIDICVDCCVLLKLIQSTIHCLDYMVYAMNLNNTIAARDIEDVTLYDTVKHIYVVKTKREKTKLQYFTV